MEAKERRRSLDAPKTSKKGRKQDEAPNAEEEARRREAVRETLREKLELERSALQVVERLLDDSVSDDFLVDCARFITPANYKDAIEERSIAKLCGYPVCPNNLGKIPAQQYKISTKTNKVYDITERKCFCSNFCYRASKDFELQISTTPLWLRQHENPTEIRLMKNGDGGSPGEEVCLVQRGLQLSDIENVMATQPEDSQSSAAADHIHSSSGEQEQEKDFVSSFDPQQQGPKVHWGDLPKYKNDGIKTEGLEKERGKILNQNEKESQCQQNHKAEEEGKMTQFGARKESLEADNGMFADKPKEGELHTEKSVEGVTAHLNQCSLHTQATSLPNSPPPQEDIPASAESIIQVGMSKRGAAALRDLLKKHSAETKQKLLGSLRRTIQEWTTEETLKFLYGKDRPPGSVSTDVTEEPEQEEELDEDDLDDSLPEEDERGNNNGKKPSDVVPDYETLRKQTQQMELRVKEFYKGTWILPDEAEVNGNKVTDQEQSVKKPVLPLVDSHAQHLIQKRITVEKLSNCLRNILGPLRLTMNVVITDLNNLVRTFRFTNTNIVHKTPEWTLIAIVLLHLLSEVSPVIREALAATASVEYLNTLMSELGLQEQDLLQLVRLLKNQQWTPT